MKYLKFLGLIVASVMLVSCGSSGGGGGADVSSGTSTITIAIGGSGQASIVEPKEDTMFAKVREFFSIFTPSEAVAGWIVPDCNVVIPLDVLSISISITGDGIPSGSPITEEVLLTLPDDHCDAVIRTFTVPNGNKVFSAIAEDSSGRELYIGSTPKTINGADFVQIFMQQACNLFVDVKTGRDFSEGINDCTDRANPCESITHPLTHPDIDASNKIICVASGVYDEEYGNEDFPILLKNGTEIRCEGENHTSVIAQYDSSSWNNPTIGVVDGAISASINGCRVVVHNNETGISDSGANLTVDNCLIVGGDISSNPLGFEPSPTFGSVGIELGGNSTVRNSEIWYNEVGIDVIGGDPTINNNHLSCNGFGEGGIDLKIDNRSEIAINAQNNAWDNIPIYLESAPCTEDGTDICVSAGVTPDTTGATEAIDGCPQVIPEPECYTDFDCPEEFMTCTDGICEFDYVIPLWITPPEAIVQGCGGAPVVFTANDGVPPYSWSDDASSSTADLYVLDDTTAQWADIDFNFCDGGNVTITVTDSVGSSVDAYINVTQSQAGSITHNGVTYGTVTSSDTERIWLDRNLGASQVCTSFDDAACYGDKYQWGRNHDGHQVSTSATTATQATDITNAGTDFITGNDWTTADSNGTLRTGSWNSTDGTSVCPVGYRVPTTAELDVETTGSSSGMSNATDAFNSFLKLPSDGYRGAYSGIMSNEGVSSGVWTSSDSGSYAYGLNISSTNILINPYERSYGYSVRCIQHIT